MIHAIYVSWRQEDAFCVRYKKVNLILFFAFIRASRRNLFCVHCTKAQLIPFFTLMCSCALHRSAFNSLITLMGLVVMRNLLRISGVRISDKQESEIHRTTRRGAKRHSMYWIMSPERTMQYRSLNAIMAEFSISNEDLSVCSEFFGQITDEYLNRSLVIA